MVSVFNMIWLSGFLKVLGAFATSSQAQSLLGITFCTCFFMLISSTGVTRQDIVSVIVQEGGDVTLPCETATNDLHNCAHSTWRFSPTPRASARDLVVQGQTGEKANAKSDRLSVTENCSLVIKKVTVEDVGLYICSGTLDLSVIKGIYIIIFSAQTASLEQYTEQ